MMNMLFLKFNLVAVLLALVSMASCNSGYTEGRCASPHLGVRIVSDNSTVPFPLWQPAIRNYPNCIDGAPAADYNGDSGVWEAFKWNLSGTMKHLCYMSCSKLKPSGHSELHLANHPPLLHWIELYCLKQPGGLAHWVWLDSRTGRYQKDMSFPDDFMSDPAPYCYENVKVPVATHRVVKHVNKSAPPRDVTPHQSPMPHQLPMPHQSPMPEEMDLEHALNAFMQTGEGRTDQGGEQFEKFDAQEFLKNVLAAPKD
eukprot:477000_1